MPSSVNSAKRARKPLSSLHPVVIATGWVSFFTDLGSELIYPLIPIFLTVDLSASRAILGLIEGLAEGVPAIIRWVAGGISDQLKNRKWIIFTGYAISSATKPLIGLSTTAMQALAFRVIDRVGKGIRGAPRDALVADLTDANSQGYAFGFQRMMDHAGAMIGGLVSFILVGVLALTLRNAIILSAIPGIIVLVLILIFVRDKPGRQTAFTPAWRALSFRGFPGAFYLYLVSAVIFAFANSSDAFLLLRSYELGVAVGFVPLLWVLLHLVKAVTSLWGGRLSDTLGRKPVLIFGWTLYSLVYFAFAFASAKWAPWLLFTLYGFFYGATEGTAKALVTDLVKEERRGTAFGILGTLEGVVFIFASIIAGVLWDATGSARLPLMLSAILSLLATLWLASFVRIKASD